MKKIHNFIIKKFKKKLVKFNIIIVVLPVLKIKLIFNVNNKHKNLFKNQKQVAILSKFDIFRLEEGKGTEKWYISCVDLIKSRFYNEEMQIYGIKDI